MAEWLIEEGIGEHRAALFDGDQLLAARTDWREGLARGLVAEAILVSRAKGSSRGTACFPGGEEALVDRLPTEARQGAPLRLEVTRPSLSEDKRRKLAQARPSTVAPRAAPTLAETLVAEGDSVRIVRRFPGSEWNELMAEAFAGTVPFPGGSLLLYPTPAMLLVDVDGTLPPRPLALAAVAPLAATLRRFDIGGSVGIDFPTLPPKEERREVDQALEGALADWRHERTAMNGFGFVQLVARTGRPSLLHRAQHQPAATSARWLLRQAEALDGPGALLLTAHPSVQSHLRPEWIEELARRTGRTIRVEARPDLAIEGGHAQVVPR